MSKHSAQWLAQAIELLPTDNPVQKGTQGYAHYTTQKDHWLGWLDPNREAVKYARSSGPDRDAKFAYNHIGEPKMLLWLILASGVPSGDLDKAKKDASTKEALSSKCAVIRRAVPWTKVADALEARIVDNGS